MNSIICLVLYKINAGSNFFESEVALVQWYRPCLQSRASWVRVSVSKRALSVKDARQSYELKEAEHFR
jgi:hypothetical protein